MLMEENNDEEKASITYKIGSDGSIIVDVLIDDFDQEFILDIQKIIQAYSLSRILLVLETF